MSEHRWYAIQTTAGHENKVRSLIERRIKDDTRSDEEKPIRQALVPTQEVVEIKNGKKVNVERKIYPGYVLVEMVMPGDNTKMTIELITPIAMEDQLRFAIREGGRTVGAGVVTKILK